MGGGGETRNAEFWCHSLCFPALQGVFCPKPPLSALVRTVGVPCAVTLGNPVGVSFLRLFKSGLCSFLELVNDILNGRDFHLLKHNHVRYRCGFQSR